MLKLAWLTDVHLNFVEPDEVLAFWASVAAAEPDAVLIGGDIAEGSDISHHLRQMASVLDRPIYFVLGNHDFYRSSIRGVRAEVAELAQTDARLTYLTASDFVSLSSGIALAGHDGWGDGRAGDFFSSTVMLNDYFLIEEISRLPWDQRLQRLNALGDQAAEHAWKVLPRALAEHGRAIFLTHVPPFREACWHQGELSDDEWAPHFCCIALGEALKTIMQQSPERHLTVLCGHTHSSGEAQILPNLSVLTGGARYRFPAVQKILEWER